MQNTSSAAIVFKAIFFFLLLFYVNVACTQQTPVYPRTAGYFSTTIPVATWSSDGLNPNFKNGFAITFPFGINLLKSNSFGISFEIAPTIKTENGISKVSTINFHPGAMFRFSHGFTFISRVAFETNGRFGVTPVFNKVVKRNKSSAFFVSVPFPIRFGSDAPATVSTGIQIGVSF